MRSLFNIFLLLAFACGNLAADDSPAQLKERFIAASEANDVEALVSLYADDAAYFPVDDMAGHGSAYIRDSWRKFTEAFRITRMELTDTQIEVFGETAASWGLWKLTAEPVGGGETVQMQGRYSDVMRKLDGTWKYIADHASIPAPAAAEE